MVLSAARWYRTTSARPRRWRRNSRVTATMKRCRRHCLAGFFTDERLKKLIELALVNNRDMRVAILNVEKSRAQYRVTRSASLPTVTAAAVTRGLAILKPLPSNGTPASAPRHMKWIVWPGAQLEQTGLGKYFATDEARRSEQISLVAAVATEYSRCAKPSSYSNCRVRRCRQCRTPTTSTSRVRCRSKHRTGFAHGGRPDADGENQCDAYERQKAHAEII